MKFYMVVLALDTTTRQGSAAVTRDGVLLGTFRGDPSVTHGERLPGDLARLLAAHSLRVADVDLFAVAAGPGSFTGLRIGIATQQGLALANNRPLVGVSALDAINHAIRSTGDADQTDVEVAAWIDAQRGQVFAARYRGDALIEGPLVDTPAMVLQTLPAYGRRTFAGDGALAYESVIRASFPHASICPTVPLLSPSVAQLAEEYVQQHGPMPPDALRPIYVRRSDAELARDRRTVSPDKPSAV